MDTSDVQSLVDDLGGNIDDLEEALAPLLKSALSASTSKLPLLDKAKLYVLATYAIESTLFSALRLNGVDAKTHPVFQELNRVKEYFAKIKTAETAGQKRSTTVDKDAARRFIKHGLAGNEKFDVERAERQGRERAGAKRKLEDMAVGTHTRFDGAAKRMKASEQTVPVVQAGDVDESESAEQEADSAASPQLTADEEKRLRKEAKQARRAERRLQVETAGDEPTASTEHGLVEVDGGGGGTASGSAQPSPFANGESSTPTEGKKSKKKRRKTRIEMQKADEERRAAEML